MGAEVVSRYEVINTPCETKEEMLFLGTSSNGIPAWVNRRVAEADLRIGIGMITPHSDAGFSGGAKIILPGVCSKQTVNAFHAAGAFLGETQLGNIESPLRTSLETFVADRIPLHFIVNVILNIKGQIVGCVAGHPVMAHRQGVVHATQSFGVPVDQRYKVVVANSYPYDVDFWQSTKGLFCGSQVVADGGCLIMLTAAVEGNSNYPLFPGYIGRPLEDLQDDIRTGKTEDGILKAEAAKMSQLRERVRLLLVSGGLDPCDGEAMGLAMFATVEAALEEALRQVPESQRRGSVCVLPRAGTTLPLVAS
jgi:nickel-dependent lactate racemase